MITYGKFINGIRQIETASGGAIEVTTGVTTNKDDDKDTVCETASKIGGYVFAYSSSVNNNALKESVNFKYSVLYALKKEELINAVNNIYTVANNNLAEVTNFGASPAALVNF